MHLDDTTVARFVEHRLGAEAAAQVEAHIDTCTACREVVAALGVAAGTVRSPDGESAAGTTGGRDESVDEPPVAIGSTVGRYVIVNVLGRGAMGVVYTAFDPDLDRKVAVKLLRRGAAASDEARARLVREAQALARVSHPAVIAVHDVGTHAGQTFVAMELVDAGTFRTWLAAEPRSPRAIVDVVVEVARGLAAAHAVGLVHRDVKPDNILVSVDGRARIGDFGLAVAAAALDGTTDQAPDPVIDAAARPLLAEALTATGVAVGTPAYMAPEQLFDATVTPKSDQFALCATLYEALHRVRPFPGTTLGEIAAAMRSGRIADPLPGGATVPAAIDRAMRRGLAVDPELRWRDLPALIAAMGAAPVARRSIHPAVVAGGIVAAIAITGLIAYRPSVAPCSGFDRQIRSVWDSRRRADVAAAIGASHRPYAAAAATQTTGLLDQYAEAWVAGRTEACRATRVRGEQSERQLEVRIRCLDRRRADLSTLVTTLTASGADVASDVVGAASALEPIAECADVDALDAQAVPIERVDRDAAAAQTLLLAGARNQFALGRYRDAVSEAAGVEHTAHAAGLREIEAEAQLIQGQAKYLLAEPDAAAALIATGARTAEAIHADGVAARARIAQITPAIGYGRFDEARERIADATAAVERAGSTMRLNQDLATAEGRLAAAEGRYEDARSKFADALELAIAINGDDHIAVARAVNNVGNALYSLGRYAEAREQHERALAIRRDRLGDDHPDVGTARINLANDLSLEGKSEDALAEYREGLRVLSAALGDDVPAVATTWSSIGGELETLGKLDDALAADRRAVELLDKRGPSAEAALAHENLAGVLDALGRPRDAIVEHRAGLTMREDLLGTDHPDVGQSLTNLALSQIAIGAYADARAGLDRALGIKIAALGDDHPRLAPTLAAIGQLELARKHAAAAVAPLERALALLAGGAPLDAAECEVMVARALHGVGRHREARTHAAAAETAYAAAGKTREAADAHALAK